MRRWISNEACSIELTIITSYPTSVSARILFNYTLWSLSSFSLANSLQLILGNSAMRTVFVISGIVMIIIDITKAESRNYFFFVMSIIIKV